MVESILSLFLLILGFLEGDPIFFVAAGVFSVSGHIGRFLDFRFIVKEEDEE